MIRNTPGGQPKLPSGLLKALSERSLLGDIQIPIISKLLSANPLVYLAIVVAIICGVYISRTRAGLKMRSVGENPAAADAAGINVSLVKYLNILIGGGICGLGGAYIALINGGGVWNNGAINGQGWIAVALVIFASWSPAKAILGSLVFGGFSVLDMYIPQDLLPGAFYKMLPFLVCCTTHEYTHSKGCCKMKHFAATPFFISARYGQKIPPHKWGGIFTATITGDVR